MRKVPIMKSRKPSISYQLEIFNPTLIMTKLTKFNKLMIYLAKMKNKTNHDIIN